MRQVMIVLTRLVLIAWVIAACGPVDEAGLPPDSQQLEAMSPLLETAGGVTSVNQAVMVRDCTDKCSMQCFPNHYTCTGISLQCSPGYCVQSVDWNYPGCAGYEPHRIACASCTVCPGI
jgi:hypothetical protein